MHINIRSILPKIDELQHIVHYYSIDCLSVNETLLNSSIPDGEISIKGFCLFRNDRDRNGGGVALYINENLSPCMINDNTCISSESVWVKVKVKYGYIIIGSIYRPPNSPVSYHDYIINDLDFISSFNYELIIMGDLNYDCYDKHNQSYVCNAKIKTLEIMYQLKQIINKPTRVTAEFSTLIDVILCTDHFQPSSSVLHISLSDHYPILANFALHKSKRPTKTIKRRNYNNLNYTEFICDLYRSDILNSIYNCTDVVKAWTLWKNEFLSICNAHAPIREYRIKNVYNPWFSKEIQNLIYERNHSHKLFIQSKDTSDFLKYKKLRNLVTLTIRREKKAYYTKQINSNDSNTTGMWNVLKHLLQSRTDNSPIDESLDSDTFNDFFSEIGMKLTTNFGQLRLPKLTVPNSTKQFVFHEININYTLKELLKLPLKSTLDVINIDNKLLRLSALAIAPSLTHIFNLSLYHCFVPNDWKIARITPIFKKKGSKDDPNNYRPISVVSSIAKILEKHVKLELPVRLYKKSLH